MKITLLFAAIALVTILLYSFTKGKREASGNISKDIPYGPFTIKITAKTGKTFNMNYGMVRYTNVAYGVYYDNQPVVFPVLCKTIRGFRFLWAVYALPGAPDPTLVAGSQRICI
ncbi:MAG: hypothetical protein R3C61_15925 [Bacteroidia bacterium]